MPSGSCWRAHCQTRKDLRRELGNTVAEARKVAQAAANGRLALLTAQFADPSGLGRIVRDDSGAVRAVVEEKDADAAARAYEQTLTAFFHLQPGEFPRLDLILLGMGPDGHTASVFPGTRALHEKTRLVVANWVEKLNAYRFTMTLPVLNHSACAMFLVSGRDKANVLREVLEHQTEELPASLVRPTNGRLVWMIDQEAASALPAQLRGGSRVANF